MPSLTAKEDLVRWGAQTSFTEGQMDYVYLELWDVPMKLDREHIALDFDRNPCSIAFGSRSGPSWRYRCRQRTLGSSRQVGSPSCRAAATHIKRT